ncbi:acyl-CoA thioesterase [Candidatus Omnitrophota bacterium]
MGEVHTSRIRVRYKETDQMKVAYYSNYFVWFEVARAELFREKSLAYSEIERDMGLWLMVIDAQCTYKHPARYDDLIDIKCKISKMGNSSISFEYGVFRDETLLAEGRTAHVFVDHTGTPKRIPKRIKEGFS